jgi:K+-transporting ATPase ATPase A chain
MTPQGWIQVLLFAGAILALTKPLGLYLYRVFEGEPPIPRVLGVVERWLLRVSGVRDAQGQTWKQYLGAVLAFSLVGVLVTLGIEMFQSHLPLNPQHLPDVPFLLAINTAISFVTNTNWQAYSGESVMSDFTQMVGLTWHNFTSAAVGLGVALALSRGLTQ